MRLILIPTSESVIAVNKYVCEQGGNPHHCSDIGKIESAISTAFYPGSYPFAHGAISRVAGALCFYLVKSHAFTDGNKRTGALVAITFLNQHGLDLDYLIDEEKNINGLAEVIESCAAGNISRDQLMNWFESHKDYLED